MNKLIILLLALTSLTAKSQSVFNFKNDMVWLSKANLFVCKYEVTNIEYREFTNELIEDTSHSFDRQTVINLYYPDTMVWITQFQNHMGDPMKDYYRWHPAFNGYPVVGITYEGALKYCEWLTEKYGQGEYKFRLPTKNEFIKYARVEPYSIAGGLESPRNEKRQYLLNYKPNRTNLDDSISRVFYNPKNNTFMRIYNDTTIQAYHNSGLKPYTHHVENYLDGYLYIGDYKPFFKFKVKDSITYYIKETDSYVKEKLTLNTIRNYYDDGFVYSCPSRTTKYNSDLEAFDDNGQIRSNYKPVIVPNKSTFPFDKNGLYDLSGNVSEMIAEKGVSMGGNWNSEVTELNYNYIFKYDAPSVLIGFRIVAERVK